MASWRKTPGELEVNKSVEYENSPFSFDTVGWATCMVFQSVKSWVLSLPPPSSLAGKSLKDVSVPKYLSFVWKILENLLIGFC